MASRESEACLCGAIKALLSPRRSITATAATAAPTTAASTTIISNSIPDEQASQKPRTASSQKPHARCEAAPPSLRLLLHVLRLLLWIVPWLGVSACMAMMLVSHKLANPVLLVEPQGSCGTARGTGPPEGQSTMRFGSDSVLEKRMLNYHIIL